MKVCDAAAHWSASPGWRATGLATAVTCPCQLVACRRRKGEVKGFTWQDYRDLIIPTTSCPTSPSEDSIGELSFSNEL